jgi:hypothetical protein
MQIEIQTQGLTFATCHALRVKDVDGSPLWMHFDEESPISDNFTMENNTVLSHVISQRIHKIHVTCTKAADVSPAPKLTSPHHI